MLYQVVESLTQRVRQRRENLRLVFSLAHIKVHYRLQLSKVLINNYYSFLILSR